LGYTDVRSKRAHKPDRRRVVAAVRGSRFVSHPPVREGLEALRQGGCIRLQSKVTPLQINETRIAGQAPLLLLVFVTGPFERSFGKLWVFGKNIHDVCHS